MICSNTYILALWTQLALAYAIHKSFIFIRVPLTAAVTPKVVKVLRGWGWNIGKRTPKSPKVPPPSSPPTAS
jgi:N-terminal acetyltransferase 2